MEFKITSTFYHTSKLLDPYPCLREFGFEIRQVPYTRKLIGVDANNNPIHQAIPATDECAFVKIDSLEQLIKLREAVNEELVIGCDSIEIYDYYRE